MSQATAPRTTVPFVIDAEGTGVAQTLTVARDLGIALGRWTFRVQGDLDPSVVAEGAEGDANFDAVEVRVRLETGATPEQFEQLRAETQRRCPVTQLFVRSGLRSTSAWEAAPLA